MYTGNTTYMSGSVSDWENEVHITLRAEDELRHLGGFKGKEGHFQDEKKSRGSVI